MPSIDIAANTREAQRNVKDLGKALDDVGGTLDDVARDGDQAGEKLERSFKDLGTAAKKADKEIGKVGGTSGGFHKAGEGSKEFKEESLANFSEVTSSFDGSMSSIGDLAQGTLGGVAANLPGIGIAAGVAAAGIGGITARFTELGEASKATRDQIIADALAFGDALDKEAVDQRVSDILGDFDGKARQAKLLADVLKINVGQAALAMAGDFESAGVTFDQVTEGINNASGTINYDDWINLKNTIDATTGAVKAGEEASKAQADAQSRTAETTKTAQAEQKAAVDETRAAMERLLNTNGTTTITVNADISPAQRAFDILERRAQAGIHVAVNGTGRLLWE